MESPEPAAEAHSPDRELLASLFTQDGPYRHRMGLRRSPAAEFYAPTPAGPAIRAEKNAILNRVGERHTLVTPEGHAAAEEFARRLELPIGYAPEAGDDGGKRFNRHLGLAVEPDLLFVQPPDWSLVWANVCFPSRWSLEGKSRCPLKWIHEAVPDLNTMLAGKIDMFLSRLAPGEGWRRANWGLSASDVRNQHPDESIPAFDSTTTPDQIFIRIEDQHLLKLPCTGVICFGIRIINVAWTEAAGELDCGAALLEKLRTMSPDIARYKGLEKIIPSFQEKI